MDDISNSALVRAYHPAGIQVSFPISLDNELTPEQVKRVREAIDTIVAGGFTATLPGVEPSEEKMTVGWIVKKEKTEDDGSLTYRIDLYSDNQALTYPILSKYLNGAEEETAFEAISGLVLAKVPTFDGNNNIQRDANPKTNKYVVPVKFPFGVVYAKNPHYNPDEQDLKKRKPQWKWLRWVSDKMPAAVPQPATTTADPSPERPSEQDIANLTPAAIAWAKRLKTPAGKDFEVLNEDQLKIVLAVKNATDDQKTGASILLAVIKQPKDTPPEPEFEKPPF